MVGDMVTYVCKGGGVCVREGERERKRINKKYVKERLRKAVTCK